MLEQIDLTKEMGKEEYKEKMEALEGTLSRLQRECRDLGIPVMILFEGFGAAGKGVQINKLIHPLDPRGFKVFAIKQESKEERMYPFLWRFWTKTPEKGRIAIFDTSWYRRVSVDRFEEKISPEELMYAYQEINTFEKTLTDDGAVLIKFFMHISRKEQKKRFDGLLDNKETAWRVSKADLKRNEEYGTYKAMLEEMLEKTETECAPWTIIEATDRRFATVKILSSVIESLTEKIEEVKTEKLAKEEARKAEAGAGEAVKEYEPLSRKVLESSTLSKADLTLSYTKEEYKKKLKNLQDRMAILHSELYSRRIPVVLGFEGWDAGGKGGASSVLQRPWIPEDMW